MAACHLEVAHAIRGAGFAGQRAFFGSAAGPGAARADRDLPDEVCKVRRVESD